jgi:phospholipid/cholesterol/gamma-HCH transport system substrate-binding protein
MAPRKNIELRVGLVILIGLVILTGSLYWLADYRIGSQYLSVRVMFEDVGTLSVGDKVTVSGVYRGKVNDFHLTDSGVVVSLLLSREVKLRRDARFTIKNMGVMGERFIAIDPGSDTLLLDTLKVVDGSYDAGIPEIMGLLGETITEFKGLVTAFKHNVESESTMDRVNRTITNLDRVTASLADFLEHNQHKLAKTTDNFLAASEKLDGILDRNAQKIDSSVNRLDRTTLGMEALIIKLDTVATSARRLAEALENEEGTVQLLLEDRRLYDDLRQTADSIDDLIADIKANPRKYINLKVSLF